MDSLDLSRLLLVRRQRLALSLEDCEKQTKIQKRFFVYMESNQWDKLPKGIFFQKFGEAYLHLLGLNDDPMVIPVFKDLMATYNQPKLPKKRFSDTIKQMRENENPSFKLLVFCGIVLVLILSTGIMTTRYFSSVSSELSNIVKSLVIKG